MKNIWLLTLITLIIFFLVACGGSSADKQGEKNLPDIRDQNNTVPIANAGADQIADIGMLVTLNGSASDDIDGDALSYEWSIVSKPAGSTALLSDNFTINPTFTADFSGDYIFQLIVNDSRIDSLSDTVMVRAVNERLEDGPAVTSIHSAQISAVTASVLKGIFPDASAEEARWSEHVVMAPNPTQFWVSPTGSNTGQGTRTDPWDLYSVWQGQQAIPANSIVWLMEGDYLYPFPQNQWPTPGALSWVITNLAGEAGKPIHIRPELNARVRIDGGFQIQQNTDYLWIWDLEITALKNPDWRKQDHSLPGDTLPLGMARIDRSLVGNNVWNSYWSTEGFDYSPGVLLSYGKNGKYINNIHHNIDAGIFSS